jgi:hypothetical protein
MNDRTIDFLSELSLGQLEALQAKLNAKIAAEAERKRRPGVIPPVMTKDVGKAAEALGLDISSLMRDVQRKSAK